MSILKTLAVAALGAATLVAGLNAANASTRVRVDGVERAKVAHVHHRRHHRHHAVVVEAPRTHVVAKRKRVHVHAPYAHVETRRGVRVAAPYTNVRVGRGVHVRAPFVDVRVAR